MHVGVCGCMFVHVGMRLCMVGCMSACWGPYMCAGMCVCMHVHVQGHFMHVEGCCTHVGVCYMRGGVLYA